MKENALMCTEDLDFTDEEFEVCEILLDLPNLIAEEELRKSRQQQLQPPPPPPRRQPFLVRWGCKNLLVCRKKSIEPSPSTTTLPLPSLHKKKQLIGKVDSTSPESPNMPLSLSTTLTSRCSDDKLDQMTREELREKFRESINGLAECRKLMTNSIKKVRRYCDSKQLASNGDLNATKQQVESTSTCQQREEPSLEVNKRLNYVGSYQVAVIPNQIQNSFIVEPVANLAMELPRPEQQQHLHQYQYPNWQGQIQVRPPPNLLKYSSSSGLVKVNHIGSSQNNNVSTEGAFAQPLDYSKGLADDQRAEAAEARRKRMMKIQQKLNSKVRFKSCDSGNGGL
ncbi:hypothetical protein ACH5RR_035240 [Cinchona calisaya]|uniref:Uncharacterized protein n=1 Tax=Cinchona calisaya TaxID=153742 RepID=A0ABD2YGH1_9GENT